MTVSREFLAGLPKAELHVHHVGSASPRIVAELAARHPDSPVPTDPAELAEYFEFTDFAHFIEVYLTVVDLIRTPDDVRLLTYEIARDMAAAEPPVRRADLHAVHVGGPRDRRGGVLRGDRGRPDRGREGVRHRAALVLRHPRRGRAAGRRRDAAASRPRAAARGPGRVRARRARRSAYRGRSSSRTSTPAIAAGLHSVPHAGETTGPETIWDAIRLLEAERIGHGTSAVQDPALVDYLGEHRIPLEVCPTSNIATRAVASYDEHPLRAMVEAGLVVTINSDDPPMFGTDLNHEYAVAAELLDLDEAGVAELARTAVRVSFAEDSVKDAVLAEIDEYVAKALAARLWVERGSLGASAEWSRGSGGAPAPCCWAWQPAATDARSRQHQALRPPPSAQPVARALRLRRPRRWGLPRGGRTIFPKYQLVGYVGLPGSPALGPLDKDLERRRQGWRSCRVRTPPAGHRCR